jgi:23S rRNA (cytosine1962-C5)-methyltransferase
MKTVRLEGKAALAAAPPPLGVRGQHRRGGADAGETVRVEAADGRFLAWGAYSPRSHDPRARLELRRGRAHRRAFFERRIARRRGAACALAIASDGVRLVHGEADGLPG